MPVKIVKLDILKEGDKLIIKTEKHRYIITAKTQPYAILSSDNINVPSGDVIIVGGVNNLDQICSEYLTIGQQFIYAATAQPSCGIKTSPVVEILVSKKPKITI